MNIAFLYEHPSWSEALIHCLESKGHRVEGICVNGLSFDPDRLAGRYELALNRINIMPSADAAPGTTFQAIQFLSCLELAGVRVVNGARCHTIGLSKAMQNALFASLGLKHPRGIAIHRQQDAPAAAGEIGFPLVFKPNVGGSGQGIQVFESAGELEQAVAVKSLDMGVDRTGLVQQYIPSDGFVYRVEILGDALFYSIRQPIQAGSFNYCAADGCSTLPDDGDLDFCVVGGGGGIERHDVPDAVLADVRAIVRAAGADFGGVEYFIEAGSGEACFYDFNPYSNFVSNGESLLGFSPEQRFADFLLTLS